MTLTSAQRSTLDTITSLAMRVQTDPANADVLGHAIAQLAAGLKRETETLDELAEVRRRLDALEERERDREWSRTQLASRAATPPPMPTERWNTPPPIPVGPASRWHEPALADTVASRRRDSLLNHYPPPLHEPVVPADFGNDLPLIEPVWADTHESRPLVQPLYELLDDATFDIDVDMKGTER